MAEEGGGNGEEGNQRAEVRNDGIIKAVGQIGQHGNVLLLCGHEVLRGQAENTAEHEEHDEKHQNARRIAQGRLRLDVGVVAVLLLLRHGKGGNGGRMVEGKDQHGQGQPDGGREVGRAGHFGKHARVPFGDQIEGQAEKNGAERINQLFIELEHEGLAYHDDENHRAHQHAGQDEAAEGPGFQRRSQRGHAELIDEEGTYGIGDAHAVDQQNGINGKEVKNGNELARADAEVLFHHFGDVAAGLGGGQNETGQAEVGQINHGAGDQGNEHQRPDAGHARLDGKKKDARPHGRAEEIEHPHCIKGVPARGGTGIGLSHETSRQKQKYKGSLQAAGGTCFRKIAREKRRKMSERPAKAQGKYPFLSSASISRRVPAEFCAVCGSCHFLFCFPGTAVAGNGDGSSVPFILLTRAC